VARIELRNIGKVFPGGAVAVRDLTLDIRDREFISFLGPSGCGKTTTLRMIAGLDQPTTGEILFDGQPVDHLAPGRRNVAMVFQSYALYPHMTVAGNLEYPLRKLNVEKAERARRLADVAAMLELEPLLARKPRQLSGGEQQRVALGRAIIREPAAFLLDEPLSNLDARLRANMRAELIGLHRRIAKTTIYVTHDQLEAMTMSDRIAVFHAGALQQVGSPAEIFNRPCNVVVASFVGTPAMTLLEGQLGSANGAPAFVTHDMALPLEVTSGREGMRVVAGLRPEDVVVGDGPIVGHVALIEPTGHETLVTLAVGTHRIVARAPAQANLSLSERVHASIRPGKLHLFASETGRRI
jgi:multiple sugar transport system ATP-binding protein